MGTLPSSHFALDTLKGTGGTFGIERTSTLDANRLSAVQGMWKTGLHRALVLMGNAECKLQGGWMQNATSHVRAAAWPGVKKAVLHKPSSPCVPSPR